MTINFRDLFPAAEHALEGLANIPAIHYVNETVWIFALVETGHLLFLTVLGGSVFALNLRILGLTLQDVTVEAVERATRPWYRLGVWGTIVTGVAMGMTTARTLLPSGAFFIKMIALIAAILLSSVVAREARAGSAGSSSQAGIARVGIATALWLGALFLLATTNGLNSGGILVGLAGAGLLAAAAQRRHRPLVIGLSIAGLAGWYVGLDALAAHGNGGSFAWLGNGVVAAAVVPALSYGVRDIRVGSGEREASRKLTAFASTLAWVTVAAAGRWIGFS